MTGGEFFGSIEIVACRGDDIRLGFVVIVEHERVLDTHHGAISQANHQELIDTIRASDVTPAGVGHLDDFPR